MASPDQQISAPQERNTQQESRLLALPAELRNHMYSYVVADAQVHLNLDGTYKSGLPFLAGTSKQLHTEVTGEFQATVAQRASVFIIHIVNFVHEYRGMGRPNLVKLIKRLRLATPDGWRRKITVSIELTDNYHQHMQDLAKLMGKVVEKEVIKPKFEIHYDQINLDDNRFLRLLDTTRWGQCSAGMSPEKNQKLKRAYCSIRYAQLAEKERHLQIAEAELE